MIMAGAMFVAPVVSCSSGSGERNGDVDETQQGWGQPLISVACMREEPRHGSELVSQCLLGMPVAIMGREGEWLDVMLSLIHISEPTTHSQRSYD